MSSHELSLLRSELKHTLHIDSKSVAKWVEDNLGVDYTPQGIVDLLNRIGFIYKKTKEVPCEFSEEKQIAFMEDISKIFEHLEEETVVYYADGVHPTQVAFCLCLDREGRGLRTNHRKRLPQG